MPCSLARRWAARCLGQPFTEVKPASAANVLQGVTDKLLSIAQPLRLSMTYDQGREMALHKKLSAQTGIAVYFCDPHSPWLLMKSSTAPEKVWGYDRRWPCTVSY